jgi:hypothetical protein
MLRYYFNISKYYTLKCTLQVHAHATSPFFTQTISFISTLRTEIFNKELFLWKIIVCCSAKPSSHWKLMMNELFLFFKILCLCSQSFFKTLQESFPVMFLVIVDIQILRFIIIRFFQVILNKSQQFIFIVQTHCRNG